MVLAGSNPASGANFKQQQMKLVKDLTVKVTYTVGLGDIEMPEEVYNQITEAGGKCKDIKMHDLEYPEAAAWLSENIQESDCMEWEAEIVELLD